MSFPAPVPGLVIRYSYLWRDEFLKGREEGVKDRPCALVLVTYAEDGDEIATRGDASSIAYGTLPNRFYAEVLARFLELADTRRAKITSRTE
ncbi:MAG: hypothetical protein AB7H70_17820 [Rhodospirillaceae bacterium]